MFKALIDWYLGALATGGYPLIALLMAIESSIVPLPSELVIQPAAHLAHEKKIQLSLTGIVIAGAVGSWLGATVMWCGISSAFPRHREDGFQTLLPLHADPCF